MRIIQYLFTLFIVVILLCLAIANRDSVKLTLIPDDILFLLPQSWQISYSVSLPSFFVLLFGVIFGIIIGYFWEFLRERSNHAQFYRLERENAHLKRENSKLRSEKGEANNSIEALFE